LLLAETNAWSQPRAVTFSTTAPDCPRERYLDERVTRLVGSEARGATAHVDVTKSGGRFDVVVKVEGNQADGERRFSAETCLLAVDAAALIVAISMFPERASELTQRASEPPEPKGEPARPSEPAEPAPERGEVAPPPPRSRPKRLEMRASVGPALDATSLPSPALGPEATVAATLGPLSFELSGALFPSQSVDSTDVASALFSMQSAGLRACYGWQAGGAMVGPCAGATAVRLAGSGRGTDRNHDEATVYWGPSLGALARVRVASQVWLRAYAESFVPVVRRPFLLDGREVHRPSSFGFSGFLGPELSF
jgi:hypothetical protein